LDFEVATINLLVSHQVVIPVKTGVQFFSNYSKTLDSGFRRNGRNVLFLTFCEFIKTGNNEIQKKDTAIGWNTNAD